VAAASALRGLMVYRSVDTEDKKFIGINTPFMLLIKERGDGKGFSGIFESFCGDFVEIATTTELTVWK